MIEKIIWTRLMKRDVEEEMREDNKGSSLLRSQESNRSTEVKKRQKTKLYRQFYQTGEQNLHNHKFKTRNRDIMHHLKQLHANQKLHMRQKVKVPLNQCDNNCVKIGIYYLHETK